MKALDEIRYTTKFITDGDKWYKPVYIDEPENTLVIKETKGKQNTPMEQLKTLEEAKAIWNIEISDATITPDQYFLMMKDKQSSHMEYLVSDEKLINYMKQNDNDIPEVVEVLLDTVMNHEDYKVRKSAFETCKELGIGNMEELEQYAIEPPTPKTKKMRLSGIKAEKAIITYLQCVKPFLDNRAGLKFGTYSDKWDALFSEKPDHDPREIKMDGYKSVHEMLDSMTMEEIIEYRNKYLLYEGTGVPEDIKRLARERSVMVQLAENKNKHLSGFDVLVKYGHMDTKRIIKIPFSLTEKEVRKMLDNMPTRDQIISNEKKLMNMLRGTDQNSKQALKIVHRYKTPYATHDFMVFMNTYTLKTYKGKELTNACCLLCERVGIKNLQNNKPIMYKFCKGSGQRERNIKRSIARKKGNAKEAKKRASKK